VIYNRAMENNKAFELFTSMIDQALDKAFGRDSDDSVTEEVADEKKPLYESLEDYTQKTGKRFRINKEESSLGLTREEAFHLRFNK
tara:strand:+ start:1298 stop:1555 length:258 start_codon:yes stop_codon:yes gene_type:complete